MILISSFRRNYSQRVIGIDLKATRNPSLFCHQGLFRPCETEMRSSLAMDARKKAGRILNHKGMQCNHMVILKKTIY